MPEFLYSEKQGAYFYRDEDGNLVEVPEHIATSTAGERMLIGAGRFLTQAGRTIKSAFSDEEEVQALRQQQAIEDELYQPLQETFPVSTAIGESLPGLATLPLGLGLNVARGVGGQLLPRLSMGQAPGTLGQFGLATGLSGIEGGLAFDPNAENQVLNAMGGAGMGAVGFGAGQMAGRVLSGISTMFQPQQMSDEVKKFVQMGGRVTPGMASGSPAVRAFEEGLAKNPAAAGFKAARIEPNQALTNRIAGESIGMPNVERMTPEVLAEAESKLQDFYQQFARGGTPIAINERLASRLMTRKEIKDIIELGGLQDLERGILNGGEDILDVRATLTGLISEASGKKAGQFTALQRLLEQFDDNVAENFGQESVIALNRANEQWRNLALLQKQGVVKNDNVSVRTLRNRLQQNYGKTYTQNRTQNIEPETAQLFDYARVASAEPVLPIVGDSGTGGANVVNTLVGDVAQGALTQDAGALARAFGTLTAGGLYSRMADDYPGFITGLLAGPNSALYGRLGASLADPQLVEQVFDEE